MSLVLTAKQIGERALRAIGAFPVTDSAPDGEQLAEAMRWLDLILAQEAGTGVIFSLIPATLTIAISNGTQTYDLSVALGADLPPDKIQFPVRAWLEDSSGERQELEIVGRAKFEDVADPDETGRPCMVYIEQLTAIPHLSIYPTPATTDTETYSILLDVQTYAPNVAPTGVSGSQASGTALTNFRQAWQRWMIAQLAHDLGSGPIYKIGEASLNRFGKMAAEARASLLAFENREHTTEAPVCEPHGM